MFLLRHRDRKSLRSPMPLGRTRILFFDADSSLICFRYINSEGSTSMLLESMLSFSSLFSCFMVLNYLSLLSAKLSVITLGNNFRIESTDSILFPTSWIWFIFCLYFELPKSKRVASCLQSMFYWLMHIFSEWVK